MKRVTYTLSDQILTKLREASSEMKVSMSRIIENALWIYIMMNTSNKKQTELLNKQFDNLREELDQRQMSIDDVLAPLKSKAK